MLRITRETDYGIILMSALAQADEASLSAALLARRCRLPVPMVGKTLKALAQAGLLISQRGAHGGYALARHPAEITVAEVVEALEGPIAITECSSAEPSGCVFLEHCQVNSHWNRINEIIRSTLGAISLKQMSQWPSSLRGADSPVTINPLSALLGEHSSVQPDPTRR